jgi:hypothetical protein
MKNRIGRSGATMIIQGKIEINNTIIDYLRVGRQTMPKATTTNINWEDKKQIKGREHAFL